MRRACRVCVRVRFTPSMRIRITLCFDSHHPRCSWKCDVFLAYELHWRRVIIFIFFSRGAYGMLYTVLYHFTMVAKMVSMSAPTVISAIFPPTK
jgi:hypothetical protein